MNRIRFSYALLFILITSTIAAVWMATKAQYFDDTFKGSLVLNGVKTDVSATVRIQTDRLDEKPTLSFSLDASDPEQLIAKGVNSAFVNSETRCVVVGYDDKRDNTDYKALVAVQFEPYNPRPNCANAVLKVESFTKMTVVLNPDRPAQRVEMVVEREFMRNPIILATEYIAYITGHRAMNFY